MRRREERLQISGDRVLQELARLSFANMLDFLTLQPDGSIKVDVSNIDRTKAAALSELRVEEHTFGSGKNARKVTRLKIKLADKGSNLERLGKHFGLFIPEEDKDPEVKRQVLHIKMFIDTFLHKVPTEVLERLAARLAEDDSAPRNFTRDAV